MPCVSYTYLLKIIARNLFYIISLPKIVRQIRSYTFNASVVVVTTRHAAAAAFSLDGSFSLIEAGAWGGSGAKSAKGCSVYEGRYYTAATDAKALTRKKNSLTASFVMATVLIKVFCVPRALFTLPRPYIRSYTT